MEFYHVLNRGVDKRNVVNDEGDRMRFVRSLYTLNDVNPPPNSVTQSQNWSDLGRKREPLVRIHAWCLMNNHYHLLLSPVGEDSLNISKFMKKLNMGYAKFFNEKYNRSGYLWQGKYKKILIANESQLLYIPYYIHLNPLDYFDRGWRTGSVSTSVSEILNYIENYRWSSFSDYQEKSNFKSVIEMDFLSGYLGSPKNQISEIKRIIGEDHHSTDISLIET